MPKTTEFGQKRMPSLPTLLRLLWTQAAGGTVRIWTKMTGTLKTVWNTVYAKISSVIHTHTDRTEQVLMGFAALLAASAGLPQQVYPFGAALLSALTDRREMLAAWIGASVGAMFTGEQRFFGFVVYFLLYVSRKAFTDSLFSEKRSIRLLESGAASLLVGIIRVIVGREMRSYALISAFVTVIVSVAASYLFAVLFDRQTAAKATVSLRTAAAYAFVGMIVLALHGISLPGVRADVIAASVLVMIYAVKGGFMHAGIVGFIGGLACGEPILCASLGLAGIVCALLYTRNAAAAFISFGLCMFGSSLYGGSIESALRVLPEVVLSVLLFYPAIGIFPRVLDPGTARGTNRPLPPPSERLAFRGKLGDALFSVSALFDKLSEKKRLPSLSDVGVNVEKAFSEVCAGCALSELCFAKKHTPADDLVHDLHAVLAARPAIGADFGEQMKDKCIRLDALCETVNRLYAADAARCAEDDRPALIASGYASMARMVSELESDEHEAAGRDIVFEKAVAKALTNADIPFESVTVRSERDKRTTVRGVDPARVPFGTEELIRYLYAECGVKVGGITFDIASDGATSLTFARTPYMRLEYAGTSKKKAGEDVCGDTASLFEGTRHRQFALLCDGMGSGREAASASRLCAAFLEKLCESELTRPLMLEMLNNALLSQSGEHFSTVDFFEADLLTGRCTFIKAGAAPTYILRGTRLYKIASETPPVGILPSFTAESTRFDVQIGDLILMVSDGVMTDKEAGDITEGDGAGELAWLAGLVRDGLPADPALIAEKLLENVGAASASDDSTAIVLRVCAA